MKLYCGAQGSLKLDPEVNQLSDIEILEFIFVLNVVYVGCKVVAQGEL